MHVTFADRRWCRVHLSLSVGTTENVSDIQKVSDYAHSPLCVVCALLRKALARALVPKLGNRVFKYSACHLACLIRLAEYLLHED